MEDGLEWEECSGQYKAPSKNKLETHNERSEVQNIEENGSKIKVKVSKTIEEDIRCKGEKEKKLEASLENTTTSWEFKGRNIKDYVQEQCTTKTC